MTQLVLATLAFLLGHYISNTPLRPALVRAVGENGYLALYSILAFVTLGWMIHAYPLAGYVPLWPKLRHLPALVMPVACILVVLGVASRNPTAVKQEGALRGEEPARGIIRVTRHPMMWGLMLWSGAHVLARGDLAALVFFGGFFVLAAAGTVLIDRRKAQALGADWERFAALTSNLPFLAIAQGRNRLVWREIGWWRPAAGLALFVALFHLHPWLFGVRPH
jgi:uncharacterized membrane protein